MTLISKIRATKQKNALDKLKAYIVEKYYLEDNPPPHVRYKEYNLLTARQEKTKKGKLSVNIKEILYIRQKGKCGLCFNRLNGTLAIDHIYPISLIDKRSIHADRNVHLVHFSCNSRKGTKHPIDFMKKQGYLL